MSNENNLSGTGQPATLAQALPAGILENQPLELAHALFRIAGSVKQGDLKAKIESYSIGFLESATVADYESTDKAIKVLEKLVVLGEMVGEIPYNYSKVIYRQFENIKSAIKKMKDVNIADLGLEMILDSGRRGLANNESGKSGISSTSRQADITRQFDMNSGANEPANTNLIERQNMIAGKIRESGNLAMRDLIALFSQVSERTLRYDLQKLCERGVIQRIGNGGPGSYYRTAMAVQFAPVPSFELAEAGVRAYHVGN